MNALQRLEDRVRALRADVALMDQRLARTAAALERAGAIDPSLWVGNLAGLSGAPDLQEVLDTVDAMTGGGGGGAPTNASYLTAAAEAGLSAERVVTDTVSMAWDLTVPGQAKVDAQFGSSAGTVCEGDDGRLSDTRDPNAHTHAESDVTGLVTDLAAKEATANKGAPSGYCGLDGSSKVAIGNLPVGTSSGTVAAGDDARFSSLGWSEVVLGSDTHMASTAPTSTLLRFTPAASATYLVSVTVLLKTSLATTGIRLSIKWPTGYDAHSAFKIHQPLSGVSSSFRHAYAGDTQQNLVSQQPDGTNWYLATVEGILTMTGTVSGLLEIMFNNETGTTDGYVGAGSVLRYRRIA